MKSIKFTYFCFLISPTFAFAQSSATTSSTGLLQILSALAFVIFIMIAAAWAFKRISPISNHQKVNVKVVGGTNLGHREKIMVIEVANQWIVVGVTANQINTLSTMDKIDLEQEIVATSSGAPFSQWLKKTIEQRRKESK